MTQHNVYKFLADNKGKQFTNEEISRKMGLSINSVTSATRKLHKYKFIDRVDHSIHGFQYIMWRD